MHEEGVEDLHYPCLHTLELCILCLSFSFLFFPLFIYLFIYLFGLHPKHAKVPRLGGQIGVIVAGLHHSYHNANCELHLQLIPELMTTLDP